MLVVLHIGAHPSLLPELLNYRGALPASHAVDGEELVAGRIYIAPPDHHLLLDARSIRLTRSPKEHHTRPAIDPLFRSAALEHGSSVIGVVLTGRLDDGTAGLQAIKDCGGITVVQDPAEVEEPSMGGLELARRLRRHELGPQPLMIALTAESGHDIQGEALRAGCDHYLAKPVNLERLCALLAQGPIPPGVRGRGNPP